MKWDRLKWDRLISIIVAFVFAAGFVVALPSGPSSANIINSSTYSTAPAANISAIAGNVTQINFAGTTSSQTWQGYFGNVTGTIVLGNAQNATLYNWALASPSGQIYATRSASTPTWTSIKCANSTQISSEDTYLGVNESIDPDSVNSTFLNTTSFNPFYVGGVAINSSQNCYATYLYNSSGAASSNFQEVLLSDTSNFIYTGVITHNSLGFDNATHDFEMLVGENGHLGDTSSTPYYFYLELH